MAKKKVVKKSAAKKRDDEEIDSDDAKNGDGGGGATEEQTNTRKGKKPREGKKEKKGRRQLGKQTVVFFMGHLIAAGHVGTKIPEKSSEMGRTAQRIRQMAEKLARQTLRHGEGDISLGGDDEEDGDGEE